MRWLVALALLAVVSLGMLVVAFRGDGSGAPGAAVVRLSSEGPYRGSEPPGGIHLPDFALRDVSGEVVRSADLRGRVLLLTFLDSQCTESCPIIASQVARALDSLTRAERERVTAVAISTDPAEDTRENVRAFLERNRALGKLRYLGGEEPATKMRALWKTFAILSSLESGTDTLHSAPVRVYSRNGVWVSTLHAGADLTPVNLAHDIRVALERG
ncbi:MAG: SCO family protein [Gaiellaceae bacterium]